MCSKPFYLHCFILKNYADHKPVFIPHYIEDNTIISYNTRIAINQF